MGITVRIMLVLDLGSRNKAFVCFHSHLHQFLLGERKLAIHSYTMHSSRVSLSLKFVMGALLQTASGKLESKSVCSERGLHVQIANERRC